MQNAAETFERRTTTDVVFEKLLDDISSLTLLPGAKLSESEIAQRFGVSRQPVRDAFNRLENLDLLLIRPQRATEVRGFSMKHIAHARFVRLAVEMEVVRTACTVWDAECADILDDNLALQKSAVENEQPEQFHTLDYQFHKLICDLGGLPMAFDTIEECKKKVDRLCILSLDRRDNFATLLDDHNKLADALRRGDLPDATSVARLHFSRLDETINDIHKTHSTYFEQERPKLV
ncbi:MAG: GntR family transcriptional regulator [Hyphomicrobiales bacterium]